jgi:hypothetical protein
MLWETVKGEGLSCQDNVFHSSRPLPVCAQRKNGPLSRAILMQIGLKLTGFC